MRSAESASLLSQVSFVCVVVNSQWISGSQCLIVPICRDKHRSSFERLVNDANLVVQVLKDVLKRIHVELNSMGMGDVHFHVRRWSMGVV